MTFIAEIVLPTLTILSHVLLAWFIVELVLFNTKTIGKFSSFWYWVRRHALVFGFVVPLTAMLGSLYFSDILGYTPCVLCWWQRVFMYSQVFVFGVALVRKDSGVWKYGIVLSLLGAVIALGHYVIQLIGSDIFCTVAGYTVSCTERFSTDVGYITIPLMAFSAFMLILGLAYVRGRESLSH